MRNRLCVFLLSLLAVIMLGAAAQAAVISQDLESLLQALGPDEEISVIVTLSDRINPSQYRDKDIGIRRARLIRALKQKAEASQLPFKTFLLNMKAKRLRSLWIINGMAVTAKPGIIRSLARMPGVASIKPDYSISKPEPVAAAAVVSEWNLALTRAPELWDLGYTGAGTVVANMDTGVDVDHQDLTAKWRGGANSWFDPNGQHPTPVDSDGHGTQVMGIMVGGAAGGTAIGVAPDARWIAVKIFNDAGVAYYSNIHAGFQWLLDPDNNPDTDDAPAVVNNSWGFDQSAGQCILEFQADIQTLKAVDIAVVFSAGNAGPYSATSVSPGNCNGSFAVGAVDEFSSVAYFSSRGPSACNGSIYPHLVAPGVNIKTSDLTFGGLFPHSYAYVYGTSFAAPHVAGAMALLWSAVPDATVSELENALTGSAGDLGQLGPDNNSGHGLVDVMEAYYLLTESSPPCTDADGDGYYAEANCGTALDCDDSDASIHPGAQEVPNDGIDQDCNGSDLIIVCTDADGDGYYAEANCGTALDCNDHDGSIHPGAIEIKHDGIDQDCNGYDLTINILKADYMPLKKSLVVEASSARGKNANLSLVGYGAMKWNATKLRWVITVKSVAQDPGTVTVTGVEGSVTAPTT